MQHHLQKEKDSYICNFKTHEVILHEISISPPGSLFPRKKVKFPIHCAIYLQSYLHFRHHGKFLHSSIIHNSTVEKFFTVNRPSSTAAKLIRSCPSTEWSGKGRYFVTHHWEHACFEFILS